MANSTITIRTNLEITQQVEALAKAMDRSRNWVVEDALKRYIAEQSWQIEGIQAAINELDNGQSVDHADVKAALNKKLSSRSS